MADISKWNGYNLKDAKAREIIGSRTDLTTEDKTSLVAAINELVARVTAIEGGNVPEVPKSLLILNNRTLTTDYVNGWFDETKYFNPAQYDSSSDPKCDAQTVTNLTEDSITVTCSVGGRGQAYPVAINEARYGKTYVFHVDNKPSTARLRLRLGAVSSPAYIDITDGTTIAIAEDGKTITVNGTAYKRTDTSGAVFTYIAFFFGSSTGTTTSYTGVSLVESE